SINGKSIALSFTVGVEYQEEGSENSHPLNRFHKLIASIFTTIGNTRLVVFQFTNPGIGLSKTSHNSVNDRFEPWVQGLHGLTESGERNFDNFYGSNSGGRTGAFSSRTIFIKVGHFTNNLSGTKNGQFNKTFAFRLIETN